MFRIIFIYSNQLADAKQILNEPGWPNTITGETRHLKPELQHADQ